MNVRMGNKQKRGIFVIAQYYVKGFSAKKIQWKFTSGKKKKNNS